MKENLLPLRAFLVLEALLETRSVTAAAARLNVSHSAISHQLRQVEVWAGVRLVMREGRKTMLTEAGEALARVVRDGFSAIRNELNVAVLREQHPVDVAALPLAATHWLMPRLADFHVLHPNVPVRLRLALNDQSPSPEPDIGIFFSLSGKIPPGGKLLYRAHCIPVASPAYLTGKPKDWQFWMGRLIHDEDSRMWGQWAMLAGIELVPKRDDFFYAADSSLLRQAALEGLGTALCREETVRADVLAGRLIQLADIGIDGDSCYWAVLSESGKRKGAPRLFWQWLLNASG
ncbi:LysR family transcriptional regulator [Agrobacterium sp. CNPSo 2736]|uniref:LysR family transcriptional regulator n=1 Tax=Agrobacterium sp. CNPSo 2736 TaxID=2499627 RepID=UPI000FDA285E|nr:LysR family transcriptional regulator [Agrobacterium sp. CNPSo 2736]RVT69888.1 LysR family transcriptional regulator [Agrobacterium sp. CNPSo 2736]